MARRMAGVGRVTVSLRKSIRMERESAPVGRETEDEDRASDEVISGQSSDFVDRMTIR
jgi:hypothetical protein